MLSEKCTLPKTVPTSTRVTCLYLNKFNTIYSYLLCISGHKIIPQGLVSTPLVASEEEVLYCFVLLEHVRLHPGLITNDNLLWLCEDVAVIECSSHLFRFIGKRSPWI